MAPYGLKELPALVDVGLGFFHPPPGKPGHGL
jgi:hypothetical protein